MATVGTSFTGGQSSGTSFSGSFVADIGATHLIIGLTFDLTTQGNIAATYGGQPMTLLGSIDGAGRPVYVYLLVSPPSGSNAFSISFDFSTGMGFVGYSLSGVDTFRAVASTNSGGAASLNVNAVSVSDDLVLGFGAWNNANNNITTTETQINQTNVFYGVGLSASKDIATTTSTNMAFTGPSSTLSGVLAFSAIPLPTVSITDVDTDNTVVDGQQNVPFTVAGFAGDITAVSLRVGADTIPLTGLTGTGTSYTFDLNDVTTYTDVTAGLPLSSGTYQNEIVATDGTDVAAINITREPKVGYAVTETAGAVATQGSIFETRVGGAPADGSQIYYPTADATSIDATGIITTDSTGFVAFVWDVTSGDWDVVTFDAGDGVGYIKPIVTSIESSIVNTVDNLLTTNKV